MLPTKHPALSNAMVTPWIAFKYKPLVTLPGLDDSSQAKNPYIDLFFSFHDFISKIPDLHLIMYLMPMATVLSYLQNQVQYVFQTRRNVIKHIYTLFHAVPGKSIRCDLPAEPPDANCIAPSLTWPCCFSSVGGMTMNLDVC